MEDGVKPSRRLVLFSNRIFIDTDDMQMIYLLNFNNIYSSTYIRIILPIVSMVLFTHKREKKQSLHNLK